MLYGSGRRRCTLRLSKAVREHRHLCFEVRLGGVKETRRAHKLMRVFATLCASHFFSRYFLHSHPLPVPRRPTLTQDIAGRHGEECTTCGQVVGGDKAICGFECSAFVVDGLSRRHSRPPEVDRRVPRLHYAFWHCSVSVLRHCKQLPVQRLPGWVSLPSVGHC